jgi:hypothetical protein
MSLASLLPYSSHCRGSGQPLLPRNCGYGIFLNEDAIIGCRRNLPEQNDEWTVERTRYMTLESVAQLGDDPSLAFRQSPHADQPGYS